MAGAHSVLVTSGTEELEEEMKEEVGTQTSSSSLKANLICATQCECGMACLQTERRTDQKKTRHETKSCSHPLHRAQLAGRLDSTAVGNVPEQGVAGQQPLACVHAKAALREGKWSEGIPQQNRGKP